MVFVLSPKTEFSCFHASNILQHETLNILRTHNQRHQLQSRRRQTLSNNHLSNVHSVRSQLLRLSLNDEVESTDESKLETSSGINSNSDKPQRFTIDFTSSVRSTTQTEALTGKSSTRPSNDIMKEAGEIPSQLLQSFSLLLLSQFILFLGVGAVIPTIPIYGQSIGLSATFNAVVISAPALALLLVSKIAGEFADSSSGRKTAMMGGMAVIALADVGTACSNSVLTLVLARLGVGLGRGYAEAGERGMLTDFANRVPSLRGRALALQQACVALGIALGAPLGGVVVEAYGSRSAFLCVSAAAVVALVIYSILPETMVTSEYDEMEVKDKEMIKNELFPASKTASLLKNNATGWKQLLTTSTWRSLAAAQSGVSFGYACKIAVVPILANNYLGGPTGAGFLLSAAGLAGLVGAPIGGWLSDLLGSRNAAMVAGLFSGASLALIPVGLSLSTTGEHSPSAEAFIVLVLLWSMGASAQGPALTALAQEKAPIGSAATALGLPRAVGDGTYILAPLLMGYVSDTMGATVPGISCTLAGTAIIVGSLALVNAANSEVIKKPTKVQ